MPRWWLTVAAGLLVAAVAGVSCSGDSDDRPPTVVSGNVRSASAAVGSRQSPLWELAKAWWRGAAEAQVPGIAVAIVNSSIATSTDEDGVFRLEGDRFGPSTLQFSGNGADARLAVTLPAGGTLNLVNVDLEGSEVRVEIRHIQIEGPITGIDCRVPLLQVLSGELVAFRVRLSAATSMVDESGVQLRCADLFLGKDAEVVGNLDDAGVIAAQAILVKNGSSAVPTPSATPD